MTYQIEDKKRIKLISLIVISVIMVFGLELMFGNIKSSQVWERLIASIGFFFGLPAIAIVTLFRERIRDYGLKFHVDYQKVGYFIGTLSFFGVFLWIMLKLDLFRYVYPNPNLWGKTGAGVFVFIELFIFLPILFVKEFFYRGFVMGIIKENIGVLGAIFFQGVLYISIEGMINEVSDYRSYLILFIGGLILGFVRVKNKSIIPGAISVWIYFFAVDLILRNKILDLVKIKGQ